MDSHVEKAATYDDIYACADYITLHVPSTPQTKGMINKETIAKMKDGVRILNFSRADLVNAADLKEALESGKVASYVTDFPTEEVLNVKGIVAIPHLGASSEEAEDNCAVAAVKELRDFLENGNIKNSVNYPEVSMPRSPVCKVRYGVFHRNVHGMLTQITNAFAAQQQNIENMTNKSKGEYSYTMLDITSDYSPEVQAAIEAIDGVLRVCKFDY